VGFILRYELNKNKNVNMSENKLVEGMASEVKKLPKEDKGILKKRKSTLKDLIEILKKL